MGFSNGLLSLKSEKIQKGDKGERGVGFKLTADRHFHLEDRRLTNLASPVDKNDAVTKGHLTDVLKAKAGTNYVNKELAKKVNKTDLEKKTESYITVWAEGNLRQSLGNISENNSNLQWSFGNGIENNRNYGWPSPADGKIIRGSISASNQAPEVNVCLVHNGSEKTDYEIVKEVDSLSNYTVFQRPLEIKAGDRINFRSDSSVRHAIVNILIEIDI